MNPFLAIALVFALLVFLIGSVVVFNRFASWPAELNRKTIHIGMGLVCLFFPFLFVETWPVCLLAIITVVALAIIRFPSPLQRYVGHVLGAVERPSVGELLFPLAVAVVFAGHGNSVILFAIPVLQLTISDSVGALVGVKYGKHKYQTDDGYKSVEGSAAFLVVAFLVSFVPLLISGLSFEVNFLISLLLALTLTLMEAISWRGWDNLFIPITCQVILREALQSPLAILMWDLLILLVMIAVITPWRRHTQLSRSAGIGAALVLYASWIVGGWQWLLGPLATWIGYCLFCLRKQSAQSQQHYVHAVFAVATPGLFWLYMASANDLSFLIYPYGLAYAANFGMIAIAFMVRKTTFPLFGGILFAAFLAFLLHAAPYFLVWHNNSEILNLSLAAAWLLVLAIAIFSCWQPQIRKCPTDPARWLRQATLAVLTSAIGAILILVFRPWNLPSF